MGDTTKKIFIGGLSFETTDDVLRSHFSAYGNVTDAVVMKDPISKRSRGFGFITYSDSCSVDEALKQDEHMIDNRKVEAKRAVPRSEPSYSSRDSRNADPEKKERAHSNSLGNSIDDSSSLSDASICNQSDFSTISNKIFVGGLHYETRDGSFRAYFEEFGKVTSAEVMFNRETHKSRGFGFVVFESNESANRVLETSHHTINGKVVEVKRAIPRSQTPSVSLNPSNSSKVTSKTSKRLPQHSTPQLKLAGVSIQKHKSSFENENLNCNSFNSHSISETGSAKTKLTSGSTYAAALRFGGRKSGSEEDILAPITQNGSSHESSNSGSPSQASPSIQENSPSLWQPSQNHMEQFHDGWSLNGGLLSSGDTWGSPFISSTPMDSDKDWPSNLGLPQTQENSLDSLSRTNTNSLELKAPSNSILSNSSGVLGNGCLGSLVGFHQQASSTKPKKQSLEAACEIRTHINQLQSDKETHTASESLSLIHDEKTISMLFSGLGLGNVQQTTSPRTEPNVPQQSENSKNEFIDSYFGSLHQGGPYISHDHIPQIPPPAISHQLSNRMPSGPVHIEQPRYPYAPPPYAHIQALPTSFPPHLSGGFSNVNRYDGDPMAFAGTYAHTQSYPHQFSQPYY